MRIAILWAALLGFGEIAGAAPYLVEFRDGSRLQLDLSDLEFELHPTKEGSKEAPQTRRLSEIEEMVLASVAPRGRVNVIRSALRSLRSDDFADRERAAARLREVGSGFRDLLQETLESAADPEIRWRLNHVLKGLARNNVDDYDHIRFSDSAWHGEVGPWRVIGNYRGSEITLHRDTLRSIRKSAENNTKLPVEVKVIRSGALADLPAAARRIAFEKDPAGKKLKPGTNISETFTDWGVKLSTSVGKSFVSVNEFEVEGARGGNSAATHQPLYEGTLTLRFCRPGSPSIAAGVRFVGCWLAIVEPEGTSLVAYDALDREIGRATTTKEGSEFLGIRSSVPIAYAKILPNSEIDSNFTIDDLTFDAPAPLLNAPDPDHFAVLLKDGARLHCKSFQPGSGQDANFSAVPDSGFATSIEFSSADLHTILPPRNPVAEAAQPEKDTARLWALLRDGSKLLTKPEEPQTTALGSLAMNSLDVLALWNMQSDFRVPQEALEIPDGGAAVLPGRDPFYLTEVERRPAELAGKREDGSIIIYNYGRLPTVWFDNPPPATEVPVTGRISLHGGQQLAFGKGANFKLQELGGNDGAITLVPTAPSATENEEQSAIEIPLTKVRSILFPSH